MAVQGFREENGKPKMKIPSELFPKCEDDDNDMMMNLRSDDTFVQNAGWYAAQCRCENLVRRHEQQHVLYMEQGVGMNTPVIIKYPFWQYTSENPDAFYVCINKGGAYCPMEINDRAVCIGADIADILTALPEKV